MDRHLRRKSTRELGKLRAAQAGVTLPELLIVLGLITYLLALMLATVQRARESARKVDCGSRLRQIAAALSVYAAENTGWLPRDGTAQNVARQSWLLAVAPNVSARGRNIAASDLPDLQVLQCPSHPVERIPSGYVMNAFAFETQPNWYPDGPVKMGKVRNSANVPWVLDAADSFHGTAGKENRDKIFFVQFHDVWHPSHLAGGGRDRISYSRHNGSGNVLYMDSHVSSVVPNDLALESFDDGLRARAAPPPLFGTPAP
jgi:prepilin-type processing-associated H-X9-DG protein